MQLADWIALAVIGAWLASWGVLLSKRVIAKLNVTDLLLRTGVICSASWLLIRILEARIPEWP